MLVVRHADPSLSARLMVATREGRAGPHLLGLIELVVIELVVIRLVVIELVVDLGLKGLLIVESLERSVDGLKAAGLRGLHVVVGHLARVDYGGVLSQGRARQGL